MKSCFEDLQIDFLGEVVLLAKVSLDSEHSHPRKPALDYPFIDGLTLRVISYFIVI